MPLILIGGAAGVVIGVLNSTGLAFQLSLLLTTIGKAYGLMVTLLLTALIAIILGMGMPTAAVYIVLVTVVAPALTDMGVVPMGAHMFLFYFGLLSMLTPPVAVASMVAASMAGSDMWRTGLVGVKLAAAAYLLPFLWVYNPALILDGTPAGDRAGDRLRHRCRLDAGARAAGLRRPFSCSRSWRSPALSSPRCSSAARPSGSARN